jgi:YVTN family beta-propeller protein
VASSVGVMLVMSVLVVTFNNLNAQTRELVVKHIKFQGENKNLLPVGYGPSDIQLDVKTNKIYVANSGSDSVSVIDSDSGNRKTIRVGPDPTSIAVDEILNRQERPLSADQLFTYLTGAISAAVAVNGVILLVPGWRRARTQRTHLRECIKMIDDDAGKSHKDAIEDKIIGYYVDGKLSEDHRQLLNDKISEYYGSVKGSESDA